VFILIQIGVSCKWTNDSLRFLLENFNTIQGSPSQIYHIALPLSPSSSWLQKCYSTELSQAFRVVKGFSAKQGTFYRTIQTGTSVQSLSCGNNTIAVGCMQPDIIILNPITGSQTAVLSGHINQVTSLAFSPDGTSLVSGSDDHTVNLWDMQTGGVVRTFRGHTEYVFSVSISLDSTRIVSGSEDGTICFWDSQTGKCEHVIQQQDTSMWHVSFSPIDPGHFITISDSGVQQWDISGHITRPTHDGSYIAFSPNHSQFALCSGAVVTIRDSYSRAIVAEFHTAGGGGGGDDDEDDDDDDDDDDGSAKHCCFSPDGTLVAAVAGGMIYVWDISSSYSYIVGRSGIETKSLVFSSSSHLISAVSSCVMVWQVSALLTDQVVPGTESIPPTTASLESVSLQAREGIAISCGSDGVVKTWDILTGLCKGTFKTPVSEYWWRDAQLIDGRLIFVWNEGEETYIWDAERGELLQTLDASVSGGLRISGDGSKLFCLEDDGILRAWNMWTWELVGEVEMEGVETEGDEIFLHSPHPGGSVIWVRFKDLSVQGWDFGTLGSPPIPLSKTLTERPHLEFIGGPPSQTHGLSWIQDTSTGKKVLQLSGDYSGFCDIQWDGQYLLVGYSSDQVLILDFNYLSSQ